MNDIASANAGSVLPRALTKHDGKELVDEYIYYNNERIQLKTGQTPMEVRYAYVA